MANQQKIVTGKDQEMILNAIAEMLTGKSIDPKEKPKKNNVITINSLSDLNGKILHGLYLRVIKGKLSAFTLEENYSVDTETRVNINNIEELNNFFKLLGHKTKIELKKKTKHLVVKSLMDIVSKGYKVNAVANMLAVNDIAFMPLDEFKKGVLYYNVIDEDDYCYMVNGFNILKSLDNIAYTIEDVR